MSNVVNMTSASNMLNVCAIEGRVSTDIDLEFDEIKKVSKATFHIKNTVKTGRKSYTNDFYVVLYGKRADDFHAKMSVGKPCTVSGKITTWFNVDELGNKTSGAVINATDFSC